MYYLIIGIGNLIVLGVAANWLPGAQIDSWGAALGGTVVLTLVNLFVRPLLLMILLPINIFTFGLFSLLTNAWMVMLADKVVRGFVMGGFWNAVVTALLIMLVMKLAGHWRDIREKTVDANC